MAFSIRYYSEPGGDSPAEYLLNNPDPEGTADILRWLETLASTPLGQWPHTRTKKVTTHIWQLNVKHHRVLYFLHDQSIVVVHAFRKPKPKVQREAYKLAERRYSDYVSANEG